MEMLAVYVNETVDGVEKSIWEQLRIQMILRRVSGDIWMWMRSLRFIRRVAWLISMSICAHNLHLFRSSFFLWHRCPSCPWSACHLYPKNGMLIRNSDHSISRH